MARVSPAYNFQWQDGQDNVRISGQTALNACRCNGWKMRDCKPKKNQCRNACHALAIQKEKNCSTVQTWGFHGMPWEHANFCCDTDAFGPNGFPDCWDEVHLWLQSLDLSELTHSKARTTLQKTKFLSVASLWLLQNQPSVLALFLNFD